VCLTALEPTAERFVADVSAETLSCTTLGALRVGDAVNLEPALTLQTPLGGHLVSGHVDGIGTVISREPEARSERFTFEVPDGLARYVAPKGSICIDGVSLTVTVVTAETFAVALIPTTLELTNLSEVRPGSIVNVEVDVLARYAARREEIAPWPAS